MVDILRFAESYSSQSVIGLHVSGLNEGRIAFPMNRIRPGLEHKRRLELLARDARGL